MAVPLILLLVSIGTRIYEFGITEGRYIVLICSVWFFLSTLFSLIQRQERIPLFIQASAVCLLIFSSFGPWGIEELSQWSQTQRLERALQKNGVLIEGKIQKLSKPLKQSESISIISMVNYLVSRKKTAPFKIWFAGVPDAKVNNHLEHITSKEIIEAMGIDYINRADDQNYYFDYDAHKPLTIKGYDYYLHVHKNKIDDFKSFVLDKKTIGISIDNSLDHFIIEREDTKEKIALHLTPIFEFLKQRNPDIPPQEEDVTMTKDGQSFNVRLIITNAFGTRETNKIDSFSAVLLIKMK